MGASPSRVWAGRAWDLREGAGGSTTSQLRFPKHFQSCCTMQTPLFRGCGKRNHRPSAGEISPWNRGEGIQAPGIQPPMVASLPRSWQCPGPQELCRAQFPPCLAGGSGPTQWPPQPCPCRKVMFLGWGRQGTAEGLCVWGPGPCCPGGPSEGRISVFSQLQTALPFPSLAQLRREHQVQRQGHGPPAFPTRLTPAGQGWSGRKASLSWRES